MIKLHNGTFYTSQQMFDSGFGACCECGIPHKIPNDDVPTLCNKCCLPLIIIRECFIPEHASKPITNDFMKSLCKVLRKEVKKMGSNLSHLSICEVKGANYLKIYPTFKSGTSGLAIKVKT